MTIIDTSIAPHRPDEPTPLEQSYIEINTHFNEIQQALRWRNAGPSVANEERLAAEILREATALVAAVEKRNQLLGRTP